MSQPNSIQLTYKIVPFLPKQLSESKCFNDLIFNGIVSLKYLKINIEDGSNINTDILDLSKRINLKLFFKGVGLFTSILCVGDSFIHECVIKIFFDFNHKFDKYIKIFKLIRDLHVPVIKIAKCEDDIVNILYLQQLKNGETEKDYVDINIKNMNCILFERLSGTFRNKMFLSLFGTIEDLDIFLGDVEDRIKKMNKKVIHNNLHLGHIGYIKKDDNIQTYFLDFKNAEIVSTLNKEEYDKIKNNDIIEFRKIRYHLLEEFTIERFNRKNRAKLPRYTEPFMHCFNNFEILEHIGSGAFGNVFSVKINYLDKSLYQNIKYDLNKVYALKIYESLFLRMETNDGGIPIQNLKNLKFYTPIDEELEISILMSNLGVCPTIIDIFTCYDVNNVGDKLNFILMEKLNGTLTFGCGDDIDKSILELTEKELDNFFDKLYIKIKKMGNYILHRDLHCENIGFIKENGVLIPYIIDYGLAIKKENCNSIIKKLFSSVFGEQNTDMVYFNNWKDQFIDEWKKQKKIMNS